VLGAEERRRVAHHEMGHALIASSLPGVDPESRRRMAIDDGKLHGRIAREEEGGLANLGPNEFLLFRHVVGILNPPRRVAAQPRPARDPPRFSVLPWPRTPLSN
jgi:hypothetical protein